MIESILVKGKGKITGKLITCNLRFGNVTLGQSDARHPRVDGNFCGAEARFRGSLIKLRHTPGKNSEVHLIIEWVEQVGGTCADINIAESCALKFPSRFPRSEPRVSISKRFLDVLQWRDYRFRFIEREVSSLLLVCLCACRSQLGNLGDLLIKYQYRFSSIEMRSRGIIWILFVLEGKR